MMRGLLTAIGVCALAVVFSPGCGSSKATVSGKVTYKDTPLTTGEVQFHGSGGASRSALIGPDGTYTAENVPVGDVKIAVISIKSSGKAPSGPGIGAVKTELEYEGSAIPRKFNDPNTSGLTFKISGGSQTINLALKD